MIDDACRSYRRAAVTGDAAPAHACDACAQFVERERDTAELVRRHRPEWRAPSELRERIAIAIEAARAHRDPAPIHTRRRAVVAIAAAVVVAAVVTWLVWPRADGRARADETADQIVSDYLEYAQRADKAQIASASPAELEAWYAGEVKLAATVPQLRGARIVGGRHCHLGDRSVALTFFELAGEHGASPTPLSLFVFEPRGEDWSKLETVASLPGKKKACRHERRGVALLVWQERGLDYVLAGALRSRARTR